MCIITIALSLCVPFLVERASLTSLMIGIFYPDRFGTIQTDLNTQSHHCTECSSTPISGHCNYVYVIQLSRVL